MARGLVGVAVWFTLGTEIAKGEGMDCSCDRPWPSSLRAMGSVAYDAVLLAIESW